MLVFMKLFDNAADDSLRSYISQYNCLSNEFQFVLWIFYNGK